MSGILTDIGGASAQKCAVVVFSPPLGTTPLTVTVSTTTSGAHIFYAGSTDCSQLPTHTGDSATGGTIRIGSSTGSISVGAGTHCYNALAYKSGFLDSDISQASYEPA